MNRSALLAAFGLLACAALLGVRSVRVPARPTASPALEALARDYTALLRAHVHDGSVDYAGLRGADGPKLDAVLERMSAVEDSKLAPEQRLAFRIDQYNATVLRAVSLRLHPGYTVAESGYALFRAPLVRRPGGRISLDVLEKTLIRDGSQDPRVHAALCCGARSCPRLPAAAYSSAPLEPVLEANMRAFLADTARNRIDPARKRLMLSRLFDWYSSDFGHAPAVPSYIKRYTGADTHGFAVDWLEYDWSLNDAATRPAPSRH